MAFTQFTAMLALGMLLTGTMNTISTNFANTFNATGTMAPSNIWAKVKDQNAEPHLFNHPFFQATCMFLGELLCLFAHCATKKVRTPTLSEMQARDAGRQVEPTQGFRQIENGSYLFAIPACCDMCGTGVMYAGLALSTASVFQMLRSAVVVFTALISCLALRRKIAAYQWCAVVFVVLGVMVVGMTSGSDDSSSDGGGSAMLGNILIIGAQAIVACQMCIEEKIMSVYQTPALKVVGLEGMFGVIILGLALIPMYYIQVDGVPFENTADALAQMGDNWRIVLSLAGNIFSIAFFNFFGISITKELSAAHRMVLDSVRTLLVWGISLGLGWETFKPLQLLGFGILSFAIGMYNEIITFKAIFSYDAPEGNRNPEMFTGTDHGSFLADQEEKKPGMLDDRGH